METPKKCCFVVKRYAVRDAEKWQYAVRRAKIGWYAVRKGGGGCHPLTCSALYEISMLKTIYFSKLNNT